MSQGFFTKKGKSKKPKFNNPYKVPNDVADEIRRLDNKDLVDRATNEYNIWKMEERIKSTDGELERIKEDLKKINKQISEHPDVLELQDQLKKKKEAIRAELEDDGEKLKSEIKNKNEEHDEPLKGAKNRFQLAFDEIANRKQMGTFEIRNGTGK